MRTKIGAWATVTDGDSIEWALCGESVEFHVGELDVTLSARALASWLAAAQSAQQQLKACARQRDLDTTSLAATEEVPLALSKTPCRR
ncbi:MAG TPA: hypothetical protein VHX38_06990 [Pseudonocardiaceae bacterium]|jgi:hypothetical protein|nr:hypothetical protein [Pseudonocardiaceae bacterium]